MHHVQEIEGSMPAFNIDQLNLFQQLFVVRFSLVRKTFKKPRLLCLGAPTGLTEHRMVRAILVRVVMHDNELAISSSLS